jgi:hypothetical protein
MNVLKHLNFARVQKTYGGMVKKPFSVKGILVGKEKNKVQVDVGNHKMIEAVLKNQINERVGDHVSIDKSQIISMKIYDKLEEHKDLTTDQYGEILKGYGIDINKESLGAVMELEKFEVPFSKESIEKLIVSKQYLDVIHQGLNHDTAVKLLDQEMDIENDSLEKVANAIKEMKEEERHVSPWSFFSKREKMTTEEAEKIAKSIYGSSMGKDVTDIIKALHREKAIMTKKNIERVYDLFYRLGKLEEMQNEDFVNVYKEGIEPTIQNLYNAKYYVKEGCVPVKGEASEWAVRNYEVYGNNPVKVSNKDLKLMKENILSQLKEMGIETTKENINLAKVLIKMGISLTRKNMDQIQEMKEALNALIKEFDIEKACKMLKNGMNIEKQDIRKLAKLLENMYKQDQEKNPMIHMDPMQKEMESTPAMKEVGALSEKVNDLSRESFVKGINRITNINRIFDKVKTLKFQQISFHLSKGIPLNLKNINSTYDELKGLEPVKDIPLRDEERIKDYIKANEESLRIKDVPQEMIAAFDAGKSLLTNGLKISIVNIKRVFGIYGQYSRIRRKLSPQMVMDSVQEGKALENVVLSELDKYVDDKIRDEKNNENVKRDRNIQNMNEIEKLVKNISSIGEEKSSILSLVIKNNMLFSLKEIEGLSLFLKNKQQVGHKIGELIQQRGEIHDPILRQSLLKLEKLSRSISQKLKSGLLEEEKDYHEWINHIGSMEKDFRQEQEDKDQLKEHMKQLADSMQKQKKLRTLQLPVLMGDEFKNLQIYVQNNKGLKKKNKKELTTLMNLDTKYLGHIQMKLNIENDQVDLTIGADEKKSINQLKKQIPYLQKILQEVGYKLREITFDRDSKKSILEQKSKKNQNKMGIFNLEI